MVRGGGRGERVREGGGEGVGGRWRGGGSMIQAVHKVATAGVFAYIYHRSGQPPLITSTHT